VPVPVDNPQSAEKIALGDKLFHDVRFSATGWQFIDVNSGNVNVKYSLTGNQPRTVAFSEKKKQPQDTQYQDKTIPPQEHY
jgi:hypothetical protein